MVTKLKTDRLNLTLMTHDWRPCRLVPNVANDSSIRALPHWQRVYGSQIKKKDRLNLTLMTHDREPCQLVQNMANDSPKRVCHTGSVFMAAKLKKRQAKPNPNDS